MRSANCGTWPHGSEGLPGGDAGQRVQRGQAYERCCQRGDRTAAVSRRSPRAAAREDARRRGRRRRQEHDGRAGATVRTVTRAGAGVGRGRGRCSSCGRGPGGDGDRRGGTSLAAGGRGFEHGRADEGAVYLQPSGSNFGEDTWEFVAAQVGNESRFQTPGVEGYDGDMVNVVLSGRCLVAVLLSLHWVAARLCPDGVGELDSCADWAMASPAHDAVARVLSRTLPLAVGQGSVILSAREPSCGV